MNSFVTRILGIGLFTLIGGAAALQAGQQAKFHLPVTATWGSTVLQPGDYSLSMPGAAITNREFLLTGEGQKIFIPVMATNYAGDSGHSELRLLNIDGKYYVESYKSGAASKEFIFNVPSAKHRMHVGKREVSRVDVVGE